MRKILKIIILIIIVINYEAKCQELDKDKYTKSSFTTDVFNTSSGFRPGININFAMEDSRKLLSLGIYYDTESEKIVGLNLMHEIKLGKFKKRNETHINPYLFYNFIFRVTYMPKSLLIGDQASLSSLEGEKVRFSSIEHYIGMGININITKFIFIKSTLGFGYYFGSIKKPSDNLLMGLKNGGNGFSILEKAGIGIKF